MGSWWDVFEAVADGTSSEPCFLCSIRRRCTATARTPAAMARGRGCHGGGVALRVLGGCIVCVLTDWAAKVTTLEQNPPENHFSILCRIPIIAHQLASA